MLQVPWTILLDFGYDEERLWDLFMGEVAENGCRHLVLSNRMISDVMCRPGYEATLKAHAAAWGLSFMDSHAPFGSHEDLHVVEGFERVLMLDRLRVAMRIAQRFGVKTMTVHVGNGAQRLPGYRPEQYHDAIIRSVESLLPLAEELDLTLCLENIWFPTNTPERLLDILSRFSSSHLGICYDSGHANLMRRYRGVSDSRVEAAFSGCGAVPYDEHILEKLLPHVVTCHLHDNHGLDDEHSLPGRGDVDWEHVMGLLGQAPRLACVQSEVIPSRGRVPLSLICRTFERLLHLG